MTRSERIAERIKAATAPIPHLTKGNVADWIGISRPALDRRLKGEVDWHYDELEALATLLDTTVEELVSSNGSTDP